MKRKLCAIVSLLAMSLCLFACGSTSAFYADSSGSYKSNISAVSEYDDMEYYDGDYYEDDYDDYAVSQRNESSSSSLDLKDETPSVEESQKLVYMAEVSMDTTDYKNTIDKLNSLVGSCDVFAEYQDDMLYGAKDLHIFEATFRVPADKYDEFVAGLDNLDAIVTNKSSQILNITREYSDNEVVIDALEIQEQRLLSMMDAAETIDEMITVEDRLSEVQMELNYVKTYRETMDSEVNLSTVHVRITEVEFETTTTQTSYLSRVTTAFADMWDDFVDNLGDFGIGLIYAIPGIVIILIVVLIIRAAMKNSEKKRLAAMAARNMDSSVMPQSPLSPQELQDFGTDDSIAKK